LIVVPQNGTTGEISNIKSLLFNYSWELKKQGNAPQTIERRVRALKTLAKRGVNLFDPESVKLGIAQQNWTNKSKNNTADAYTILLKMLGKTWEKPKYIVIRKMPFIPKETELNDLIASSGYKTSSLLQTLKETGMRIGEAQSLKWNDIDFDSRTISVTPEKGSNPRIIKISNKLTSMLIEAKRRNTTTDPERVFANSVRSMRRLYEKARKRASNKLQNSRLLKIHFHTFRYWKGTMLYHETKDVLHVKYILGHKNIKNTELYIQLEQSLFTDSDDGFICKVARTLDEAIVLIEAGFEKADNFDNAHLYKKRK
jgi:integrase